MKTISEGASFYNGMADIYDSKPVKEDEKKVISFKKKREEKVFKLAETVYKKLNFKGKIS